MRIQQVDDVWGAEAGALGRMLRCIGGGRRLVNGMPDVVQEVSWR